MLSKTTWNLWKTLGEKYVKEVLLALSFRNFSGWRFFNGFFFKFDSFWGDPPISLIGSRSSEKPSKGSKLKWSWKKVLWFKQVSTLEPFYTNTTSNHECRSKMHPPELITTEVHLILNIFTYLYNIFNNTRNKISSK